MYTLNFETKSILSDRAWVNLESSGIFFCVFLGFGYKITDKPWIPSDNLDPASTPTVPVFVSPTGQPIGLFHLICEPPPLKEDQKIQGGGG